VLKNKIIKLYDSGLSLREIGESLSLSHEAVRRIIPKQSMRRKRMSIKRMAEVYKTYRKTQSYQETAERLGLESRQTAYRIVAIIGKRLKNANSVSRV